MTSVAETALAVWGMEGSQCSLVAARENQIYRVQLDARCFALRLHRPGLHSDTALRSEHIWLTELSAKGVGVPTPVSATDGGFLHLLEGTQVDMLEWRPGRPLGSTAGGIDHEDRTGVFCRLGRALARLHAASDTWRRPDGFWRWSWNREGMLGDAPLWGRFWKNPNLTDEDRALMTWFRATANRELAQVEDQLDYGLIHADLVRENVLVEGDGIWLIDFDDAGFGFRLFDIATTLLKNLHEPDFDMLQQALLAGYRSERPIDTTRLDLFMALRAVTYVGWIVPRLHEDGAEARNQRFLESARGLLRQYQKKYA